MKDSTEVLLDELLKDYQTPGTSCCRKDLYRASGHPVHEKRETV